TSCPATGEAIQLALEISVMELDAVAAVFSCDLSAPPQQARALRDSAMSAALRAAHELLQRGQRPWIELRRDALAARDRLRTHRRALDAVLAAAAVLMLAITAACLIRAAQYRQSIRAAESQLAVEFHKVFPAWET